MACAIASTAFAISTRPTTKISHAITIRNPVYRHYLMWEQARLFELWNLWDTEIRKARPDACYIANFFERRYSSKGLALLVSLVGVGVLFVIPYLQIQLTGLGIIVQVASFDQIQRNTSMLIAVCLVAIFVFFGGMRAVAWLSVIKDFLMILAALSIGIYVPVHYFGGVAPLFHALSTTHPTHLVMPGTAKTRGHLWIISTVILSACVSICGRIPLVQPSRLKAVPFSVETQSSHPSIPSALSSS
jgi:Na+/proline symporter